MTTERTTLKYQHILEAVYHQPWAILPSVYATICDLVRFRADGHFYTQEEIQARIGAAPVRPGAARNGSVAVLPLFGVVSQRQNLMSQTSGGTSTEQFTQAFRQSMQDPNISAVVLDVDSPGGSVFGVQELADEIFQARGQKPIVAVANSLMASAAYWIGAAADELVVTPSGEVGSIGVLAQHTDVSQAEEMAGVKNTLISTAPFKAEGNPFEPLTDEARAEIQRRAEDYMVQFVSSVARSRNTTAANVRQNFGQGRVVGSREAVRLGMADRVATLDQTVARLLGAGSSRAGQRAEFDEALNNYIGNEDLEPLMAESINRIAKQDADWAESLIHSDQAPEETTEDQEHNDQQLLRRRSMLI